MDNLTLLYVCGFYNILLSIFHILFWRIFKWKITLNKGSKTNKAIIQIINIQLIYLFAFMAIIYLLFPTELLNTKLGNTILIGYAGFWIVRFIQQFIFLKQKGKFVISLSFLFFFGAVIHLLPILLNK
jgi:hypothetical protein